MSFGPARVCCRHAHDSETILSISFVRSAAFTIINQSRETVHGIWIQ